MKFIYLSLFLTCLGIYAVPTPPTIEELIKNSDFIAKSRLVKLKENKLNKYTISVNATAEIITEYKAKTKMPEKIDLAFTVLPEYFGKWLKAVPKEDEYILFFVEKEIKDRKGNPKKTIGLYEPHVFAFKAVDPELEKILNTITAAKE